MKDEHKDAKSHLQRTARADAVGRHERRSAPQGHAAAPQVPEAQPRNSTEDEAAEAASQNIIAIILGAISGALVGAIAAGGGLWAYSVLPC